MQEVPEIFRVKMSPVEKWIISFQEERVLRSEMECSLFFKKRFKILMASQNFILNIEKLRSDFNISPLKFTDIEKCLCWAKILYKNKKKKKLFDLEINNLLKKFMMSTRWRSAVEFFLLFDKYPKHLFPPPFDIMIRKLKTGLEFQLIIYRSTTRKDLIKYWKLIKRGQTLLAPLKPDKPLQKGQITFSLDPKTGKGIILPNYSLGRKRLSTSPRILDTQRLKKQKYKNKEIAKNFGLLEGDASIIGTYANRYKKTIEETEFY